MASSWPRTHRRSIYALEAAVRSSFNRQHARQDTAEIETEIKNEIKRLQDTPPTAEEMARAMNSIESQTIFGMQNGWQSRPAERYATYRNKPDSFQTDLDRYRKVTPADVQRVAKQYLNDNRFVMEFVPRKNVLPHSVEVP